MVSLLHATHPASLEGIIKYRLLDYYGNLCRQNYVPSEETELVKPILGYTHNSAHEYVREDCVPRKGVHPMTYDGTFAS
jgi:hypothetical protein